jgi:N-acetyl-alpha-D-muramate 1-phosphate uridylyltransferase
MNLLPVAILAGGLATRLRPLTETIPKVLIEIQGEPFLAHQLRLLASHGIRRAVLCTGHMGECVAKYAGDGSRFGLALAYSPDGPLLQGTGGAIRQALPLLDDNFFVLYGDSYLPCDYGAAQRCFFASGKAGLMSVFRNEGQWDTSNVEWDGTRILAYDKVHRTPRMRHIDYGLGVFSRTAFDLAPAEGPFDLSSLYKTLLEHGQLTGWEVPQRFYEIGSFAGIQDFNEYLEQRSERRNS